MNDEVKDKIDAKLAVLAITSEQVEKMFELIRNGRDIETALKLTVIDLAECLENKDKVFQAQNKVFLITLEVLNVLKQPFIEHTFNEENLGLILDFLKEKTEQIEKLKINMEHDS